MSARVPQDVDLEDRLLFGLTATRFGELGVAILAAFAAWRMVPHLGSAIAALALGIGVALGWGRWRGRAADHWALVGILFTLRTRRLEVDRSWFSRWPRTVVRRRLLLRLRPRRSKNPGGRTRQRLRVLDSPIE